MPSTTKFPSPVASALHELWRDVAEIRSDLMDRQYTGTPSQRTKAEGGYEALTQVLAMINERAKEAN